ncbi:retrotransposon protein, putative, ty1-copia subclass [Tanacetum coccineum]
MCHSLPRLEDFIPKSRRCRRLWVHKLVGVFVLELAITFPRVFWTSTCIPTDFNDRYMASFELLDLTVHNLYGFFNEIEFVVELDFLQGITRVMRTNISLGCRRGTHCVLDYVLKAIPNDKLLDHGFIQFLVWLTMDLFNVLRIMKFQFLRIMSFFNAISCNGIYEIDMHDLLANVNSVYNVSNKRVKHNLDSTYLWHYRLAHINKKCIKQLQHDRLLKSTDDVSFDQCESCLYGKMTKKPFPHSTERAKDLLGIIHTDAAMLDPESKKWVDAMNAEMQSMMDDMIWVLVDLPPNSIRILISIAAFNDHEIWQMDVKTSFLNGYLDEDIYMVQREGFVDPKHPRKVCKLQRSIYGFNQASRSSNKRFDTEIKKFGFAQNPDEPYVYQKASGSNVTFLILYVDDIIIMDSEYIVASEAAMELFG